MNDISNYIKKGFASSDLLLVDFERRKDELETVRAAIKELHEKHFLLSEQIKSNTRKANQLNMMNGTRGTGFSGFDRVVSSNHDVVFPPIKAAIKKK
jgi:hypothetical protein